MSKKAFVFLIMALVIVGFAFSDADKTGTISGIVKNPQGEPLAGIIVLLKSPALILPEVEAVTDTLGMYRFPFLSPGSYELMFILDGFQQITRSGIEVIPGREVMQDIVYALRAPDETVVVEGSPPELPQWNKISKIRLILYRLGFFTLGPKPHSNHPNIPL